MRRMGFWELFGIFVVLIPFAWYVCMDGFRRKPNKPSGGEENKGPEGPRPDK